MKELIVSVSLTLLMVIFTSDVFSQVPGMGIPLYPGASLSNKVAAGDMMPLPAAIFYSKDELSQVMAYYKKELNDWKYKESWGNHYFWTGREDYDPMKDMEEAVELVILLGYDDLPTAFPEGMRSRIEIHYME